MAKNLGFGVLGLASKAVDKFGAKALSPAAMLMDGSKKKKSKAEEMMAQDAATKGIKTGMKKGGKTGYKTGNSVKARGEGCCKRTKKCKMY